MRIRYEFSQRRPRGRCFSRPPRFRSVYREVTAEQWADLSFREVQSAEMCYAHRGWRLIETVALPEEAANNSISGAR